jgi:hypothetical protein
MSASPERDWLLSATENPASTRFSPDAGGVVLMFIVPPQAEVDSAVAEIDSRARWVQAKAVDCG